MFSEPATLFNTDCVCYRFGPDGGSYSCAVIQVTVELGVTLAPIHQLSVRVHLRRRR